MSLISLYGKEITAKQNLRQKYVPIMVSMQYEIVKSWLWTVYNECMEYWNISRYLSVLLKIKTKHLKNTPPENNSRFHIWLWYSIFACTNSISEINSVSNMPFCEIIVVYYNYMVFIFNSILLNHIYFKAIKSLTIYFHS